MFTMQYLKEVQLSNTLADVVFHSSKLFTVSYPRQSVESDIIEIGDLNVYLTPLCGSSSLRLVASNLGIQKSIENIPLLENKRILILSRNIIDRVISFYNKKIFNCNTVSKCVALCHLTPFKPRMDFDAFINELAGYPVHQMSAEKHLRSIYAIKKSLKAVLSGN